ncbi:MAG TPA: class I SAM-dependent RNA methyltransferase [Alphaproteobacteria bacterium]|jgi:23S rRNA (uracil1939-C5)-methyltransferase|nr:class I SAM-dependent RNA methyltransferase [Alphaproteobacteria bacterium]
MAELTVTIGHLGALGDGVAETPNGRLHIPFTTPGDTARVAPKGKDAAALVQLLEPGPNRTDPTCRHFGTCGGCALQHLRPEFIAEWKRARVASALARAGLDHVPVNPTITIPPGTRRRATLAAMRIGKRVLLGFAERASHRLIDLEECPVLRPELARLIAPIRARLPDLLTAGESADIALTWTETGADLVLIRKRPLILADREILAAFAETADLASISWRAGVTAPAEPVAARRTPSIRIGRTQIAFAPGTFLQPSAEGEAALMALVTETLKDVVGPIADLFSGLGTFAIPASVAGPVSAYDADGPAIATLQKAAKGMAVAAHRRDLFREPLTIRELENFTAAIVDPPRAGAERQARMLADSAVPLIAYVSCNPVSFARDAAILTQGGYRLESATPLDQFAWSPHVELFGAFRR